jgi:hypothetical protein
MNKHFSISPPFRVPDGTMVSPFLNIKHSESDLSFDVLAGSQKSQGCINGSGVYGKVLLC